MSFSSFQPVADPIPHDYRTPSPPIRFHEPLSPKRVAESAAPTGAAQKTASSRRSSQKASQNGTTRRKRKSSKITNSQNAMDGLASAMLSANGSSGHQPAGSEARVNHALGTERPSKRSKSYHVSKKYKKNDISPQQSQWSPSAVPVADAELLLNFSQRACSEAKPTDRSITSSSAKLHFTISGGSPTFSYKANRPQDATTPTRPAPESPQRHLGSHTSGSAPGGTLNKDSAKRVEDTEYRQSTASEGIHEQVHGGLSKAHSATPGPEAQFLKGIEAAAETTDLDAGPISALLDAPDFLSPNPQQSDSPSICAGCNFHRNTSLREAEFEVNSWISCDGCKSWFHFACAGFKNEREVRAVDKFRCKKCKPVYGATTYVRKSARAHSAIDYAGLNEGIVKTSDESPEHHYIKPIKEGTIKFDPEFFARMRPELATREFFERGDGMKEPIVIPAIFNPRPRHIPDIELSPSGGKDGEAQQDLPDVNDASALEDPYAENLEYDQVDDEGQDRLGMVIPPGLTVRKVSELYGPEERIEVIDVKSQNGEDKRWNMKRWVEYYESTGSKVVRNVISLEVSQSRLGALIKRPDVVRDLDLQDSVWPADLKAKGDFPKVQFYCLMSVADCYTDFHIDFGGSSVYYHILKGKKTFFFIPPHEKHLKKYEEWCNSPAQNWTFLGDQTKECYRVDLSAGDTMLIPAGWIHAVWTPEDSLVIGGNFLTRMHYPMQIRVTQIEKATHVARKFRYPAFQKIMWFTALRYLEDDPLPDSVAQHLTTGQEFDRAIPTYLDYDGWGDNSVEGKENFHRRYYSKAELDGMPELGRYLQRTALIALGNITDGISVETRNAVKRSVPKVAGDPLATVKKLALWYTWKRGNETIPHWAYPDYVPEGGAPELAEKKVSARTLKKLDREAALQAWKIAPDRQSSRVRTQPQNFLAELGSGQVTPTEATAQSPAPTSNGGSVSKPKVDEELEIVSTPTKKPRTDSGSKSSGPRRPACETCRKSRRACKHREDMPNVVNGSSVSPIESNSDFPMSSPTNQDGVDTLQVEFLKPESGTETVQHENGGGTMSNSLGVTTIIQTKPSGRNKACKDCRKSKRRCVHDEFGNEDPVKLAEAALPRPQAKKRKVNSEGAETGTIKKLKRPKASSPDKTQQTEGSASESNSAVTFEPASETTHNDSVTNEQTVDEVHDAAEQEAAPELDSEPGIEASEEIEEIDEIEVVATSPAAETKYKPSEYEEESTVPGPTGASTLVSPPESAHTDAEQTPPAQEEEEEEVKEPTLVVDEAGPSYTETSAGKNRYTPDSGTHRRASTSSTGKAADAEATSPTLTTMEPDNVGKRRGSRLGSESEADEESMRLIRELAAQDMGLRRRGKMM